MGVSDSDLAEQAGTGSPPEHSLRNAGYLTAAAGLIHALLFLLSFWLLAGRPAPDASDAEIVRYYTSDSSRRSILVGLYVMPFAGIAFIWFIVSLRMWISSSTRRVNELLSNVQLVSGIIFTTLFFGTAASIAVIAASYEFSGAQVDPDVARQFPQFGASLFFVFGMRMAAMVVFTTTNIGRHAGILPRWFVVIGFAAGLFLLLSATFTVWLAMVFPVWVLVLSLILFLRARQIPRELAVPSSGTLSEGLRSTAVEPGS
ncbi:MAG TPA: hypothetical protein VFV93_07675 [Thermomicrobiales bacterium]|nr:hypothetical protein [Thermomicrobiales bacterium]